MAGIYHQRHPERSVFYRVLFHYFDSFLLEYENRFEREYGYLRPVIQEVVDKYLDCGNPKCGFARVRCRDCGTERLLTFSCKVRGFCPSCHSKRLEQWGEWMREELILDVPHCQVVFTIPKMLRIFFKYKRSLLSAGWAEMIRKVFEVDPLICPKCGGRMRIISFIEDHKVIDKIIAHLKLTFHAERPPPPQFVQKELLMAAEERDE